MAYDLNDVYRNEGPGSIRAMLDDAVRAKAEGAKKRRKRPGVGARDAAEEDAKKAESPNEHDAGEEAKSPATPGKEVLTASPGNLNFCARRAMEILVARGVDIFQRGEKLVRVAVGKGVDSKGREIPVPVLIAVDQAYMRLLLSRHIVWVKPDARVKNGPWPGYRQIEAPDTVAKAILSSAGEWPFRSIAGIINSPALRYDGSVLDQPGYDPWTHLYLQSTVSLPPFPESPTKADAERALQLLEGLLSEFPFIDSASESVALSAMLSAVARCMLDVVPGHGARAPTPGTGKSYLFDIVAAILTGERCSVISVSRDENETEKRIIGMALSGHAIIHLDNVNGVLGGDALCQLIERPICNLRPLGQSASVRVDNRAIVFFNGNNCRVLGDMTRRVILAELDAREEKPAEREFSGDPVATVLADRGKYIAACMTVLRGYIFAGRPKQKFKPMNSFGEWSNTVRAALVWLGRADPCETISKAREEDPELRRLATFIAAVRPHADGPHKAIPVSRLIELSNRTEGNGYGVAPVYPELHEFMQDFADRGRPNAYRIGRWLSNSKGRVIGDETDKGRAYFRIASIYNKTRKSDDWFIETLKPVGGV